MDEIQEYICKQIQLILGITEAHGIVVVAYIIMIGIVVAISFAAYMGSRFVTEPLIKRWFIHTRSIYLHVIAKNKTMDAISHLVAATIFYGGIRFIKEQSRSDFSRVHQILHGISVLYFFLSVMFIISYLIISLNRYYVKKFHFSNQYPIINYIKVVLVILWSVWCLVIAAYFANTSLFTVLTGLGAVSAIFILIFRDSLLGIVASIQVTATNVVRIGDYIILEKFSVEGNVVDIAISTVKVLNNDNTIITIPTYSLVSECVRNWRGVIENGARRIKRAIYLDIESVTPCDHDLLQSLSEIPVISDYIANNKDDEIINLTLFRMYVLNYLANSPDISKKFVTTVRHKDSGVTGLPLEIYTFTNAITLADFEKVQAEIFEHCFVALKKFKLKVLQYPTASIIF